MRGINRNRETLFINAWMNLCLYYVTAYSMFTLHLVKRDPSDFANVVKIGPEHIPVEVGWLRLKDLLGSKWGMAVGKHSKCSCSRHDHSPFVCAAVNQPCRTPLWQPFDLVCALQDKQHYSVDTLIIQYRFRFQQNSFSNSYRYSCKLFQMYVLLFIWDP